MQKMNFMVIQLHILFIENDCSHDVLNALIAAEVNFNISNRIRKTAFQLILNNESCYRDP